MRLWCLFSYHIRVQRLKAVRVVGLPSIPGLQIFLFMLAIDPIAHCCICEVVCGTHKEYIFMYSRLRNTHTHTHTHTNTHTHTQRERQTDRQKLMMVYSHMAALSLFMQGSAHASRASATSSHSKGLYGGRGGSPGTPTHTDMGPTGLGKNPFKKNWAIAWAGLGKANKDKGFWQCEQEYENSRAHKACSL